MNLNLQNLRICQKKGIKELITPAEELEVGLPSEPQIWEGTRPRKMRIGSDTFEIRYSYAVLTNTAEWLIRRGKLKRSDRPAPIGRKRYLINTEPRHKYGDNCRAPKRLSNRLYVEVHYSTAGCINNARRLLERFGCRGDMLEVK